MNVATVDIIFTSLLVLFLLYLLCLCFFSTLLLLSTPVLFSSYISKYPNNNSHPKIPTKQLIIIYDFTKKNIQTLDRS